jgi:hypothetical protein
MCYSVVKGVEHMPQKIDPIDIIGQTIGRLTVIAFLREEPYINVRTGRRYRLDYIYKCLCSCGQTCETKRILLLLKHKKSCGCLKPENRLRSNNPSWKGHGGISSTMWKYIQCLAVKRDIIFNLDIEEAWSVFEQQGGLCALSGVPIAFANDTSSISTNTTASLDRIDSSKGYQPGNIQWLHKEVNRMKKNFDQDTFLRWCGTAALHSRRAPCP